MSNNEPTVLPVKPGTISDKDRRALSRAGVIVIEHENPTELRLLKPYAELSASDMLLAAMRGVMASHDGTARHVFAQNCLKMLEDARTTDGK